MKKLIFGALAVIIGLPGFSFQLCNFLSLLAGSLPLLLILGGDLAVYLGIEDLRAQKDTEDFASHDDDNHQPVAESFQKTYPEIVIQTENVSPVIEVMIKHVVDN